MKKRRNMRPWNAAIRQNRMLWSTSWWPIKQRFILRDQHIQNYWFYFTKATREYWIPYLICEKDRFHWKQLDLSTAMHVRCALAQNLGALFHFPTSKLMTMQAHAHTSLLMQTPLSALLLASHSSLPTLTRPSGNSEMGNAVLAVIQRFPRQQ